MFFFLECYNLDLHFLEAHSRLGLILLNPQTPERKQSDSLFISFCFWLGCGKLPTVFYTKNTHTHKNQDTPWLLCFFGFQCDRDSTDVFRGSWMSSAIAGLCSSCGWIALTGVKCSEIFSSWGGNEFNITDLDGSDGEIFTAPATTSGQHYTAFYIVLLLKGVKSQTAFHKLHKRSTSCEIKEAFPSASVSELIGRLRGRDGRFSLYTETGREIPLNTVLCGHRYLLS